MSFTLNNIMLIAITLSVDMLCIFKLNGIMLNVLVPNVIILNVVTLNVAAPKEKRQNLFF